VILYLRYDANIIISYNIQEVNSCNKI